MNKVKELTSLQALATLQRPCFSPGMLLEADDLTASVTYTHDLTQMLFRALFGCGVICGLGLTAMLTCNRRKLFVTVDSGVALDCLGDPIQVPSSQSLTYDPDCQKLPPCVYVVLCYVEKCCRPKDVSCSSEDDSSIVHTRARAGFEIRLYDRLPDCACSCEPKSKTPPQVHDPCCPEAAQQPQAPPLREAAPPRETEGEREWEEYCECYVDHNKGVCACECGCNCVLLGKIDTTPKRDTPADVQEPPLSVDYRGRRSIRPVLTGFLPCLEHRLRRPLRRDLRQTQDPAEQAGQPD
jgi:hypothetical protein